jgi:hypothetical protein
MSEQNPDHEPSRYGGLIGVLFVLALALGAIYLIERMRHSASLADCMFTRDPACRALIDK